MYCCQHTGKRMARVPLSFSFGERLLLRQTQTIKWLKWSNVCFIYLSFYLFFKGSSQCRYPSSSWLRWLCCIKISIIVYISQTLFLPWDTGSRICSRRPAVVILLIRKAVSLRVSVQLFDTQRVTGSCWYYAGVSFPSLRVTGSWCYVGVTLLFPGKRV